LGDTKGIHPIKSECWYAGGGDLTGALHVLWVPVGTIFCYKTVCDYGTGLSKMSWKLAVKNACDTVQKKENFFTWSGQVK